jgi:two-component system, LytTR family, response regulator
MSRLRVYLLDDELLALKRLERLLVKTDRVEVVGQSTDPSVALEAIPALSCDVLFTDIQMPGDSGFSVLSKLQHRPLVVFTTAYSEFALQAFQANGIDYLLKPIEPEDLDRALTKLERLCKNHDEPRPKLEALLERLAGAMPSKHTHPSRLPSRIGDRIEFVDVEQVTHFYASDKLTYASTPKKDYVVDMTISELENTLDGAAFVRVHRSTIVNLRTIKELYSWFSDSMMVRIDDGKDTELTVSRDRVKALKEKLGL